MADRGNGEPGLYFRKTKVLLTADLTEQALALLNATVELTEGGALRHGRLVTPAALADELQDHDVLIVGYEQVTAEVMDACPDLKLIASIRGGPEANISIDAATAFGIPVLYTLGRTQHAVAEYTFTQMLALARNITHGDRLVKDRVITSAKEPAYARDVVWRLPEGTKVQRIHADLRGTELFAKTLGLVGMGNIGEEVARLGIAFGMRVVVHDPYLLEERAEAHGVEPINLPDLMRQADFISLHARVTPETTGLIGGSELRLMKPSAFLINNARAALVDETALLEALREKWFAGAALDVFHKEPLGPDSPFLDLDNVILTPHLAGSTHEIPLHHSRMVAEDVLAYLDGRITRQRVKNPEVFDTPAFADRGALALG